ncbi:MAG: glutamate racemase [Desulfovibrionaceae bacterium]|nr:glutamate racemase [Desulfovibrionaceae bacterium]
MIISDTQSELPIGLFDSGVGGLTVLKALRSALPQENYIYLGDNARLPYGTKSPSTIIRYAAQAAELLLRRRIKLMVIACNTASAIALTSLRQSFPQIPIVGVVEPGAQAACEASKSGRIAVIATVSTIRGGAYQKAIAAINPQAIVTAKACPLFVPMAEEGLINGQLPKLLAEHYLREIFGDSALRPLPDTLVLGCTHFPLLKGVISEAAGPEVKIVDSANTTAQTVLKIFEQGACPPNPQRMTGKVSYLTTDDVLPFVHIGGLFMGENIAESDVERVDL